MNVRILGSMVVGKMLQWWKYQYISARTIISFTWFQPKHVMWNTDFPYEPTVIGDPMD